jgi:hypothetical protein
VLALLGRRLVEVQLLVVAGAVEEDADEHLADAGGLAGALCDAVQSRSRCNCSLALSARKPAGGINAGEVVAMG